MHTRSLFCILSLALLCALMLLPGAAQAEPPPGVPASIEARLSGHAAPRRVVDDAGTVSEGPTLLSRLLPRTRLRAISPSRAYAVADVRSDMGHPSAATQMVLTSVADASVLQGYPSSNVGDTSDMWAGYDEYLDPFGRIVRSLVRFDLVSLPDRISVVSATLRLNLVRSWDYPDTARPITVCRVISDWSEALVTWRTAPACAEAYGGAVEIVHSGWGWYEWDVTALVRAWLSGTYPNYGIMVRGPEVSGYDSSWRGFSTREGDYPPELVVSYEVLGATARAVLPMVLRTRRVAGGVLRDGRGQPISQVTQGDSLFADLAGLLTRTMYDVRVQDGEGQQIAYARLTTDEDGQLPTTALAYDLGLGVRGGPTAGLSPGAVATLQAGPYEVTVSTLGGTQVLRWSVPYVEPTWPLVYAAWSDGVASNSFRVNSHTVYVRARNLAPGSWVRVYVVADRWTWPVGTPLADVTGGYKALQANAAGEVLAPVWQNPAAEGAYDLVVDMDADGVFSPGDLIDGYTPVGFMVQRFGGGDPVQVQLACDVNRSYKDVFEPGENVYVYVNPPVQQFTHAWVHKYVVAHREIWADGDSLVDVTEGPEYDTPQYGCTNQGRVLIWPAPLTPGVYDVVIDVNRNGVYDGGIDFVDNIDSFGNPVGGFFVPGAAGSPMVAIITPAEGSSDDDGVIRLQGTVTSSAPVTWARWYVSAGNQNASGELALSNNRFDQDIYLFAGWNLVQVWARNQFGTGTDRVAVNSRTVGVWDIHAQLVWNKLGTDVDLHLVRPGGSRASQGDCYYGNCRSEDRSNNPDWGVVGDAGDNPRLDIDCTTSCTGPENITLNTLGRPESHGRYTVEVHYFSDHGLGQTQPQVHLWVRGQRYSFGPVTLGDEQWWRVCTIDWPSGAVIPIGTVSTSSASLDRDRVPNRKGSSLEKR
ncbi:MAG: DNRLRE domain-containing protein [Chloroflexi bacterium]|nr:DNRLRE domain-containing protein [Chloroflexota bacterium]